MGVTQPLTEISTRSRKINFLGSRARPVRRTDNLAAICLDNVGSSTSHNPTGLQGLLRGQLYFTFLIHNCKPSFLWASSPEEVKSNTSILYVLLYSARCVGSVPFCKAETWLCRLQNICDSLSCIREGSDGDYRHIQRERAIHHKLEDMLLSRGTVVRNLLGCSTAMEGRRGRVDEIVLSWEPVYRF
jgi:hypothetical protein